jgi:hypothetical protein
LCAALLLILIRNLNLENLIANTLDLLQLYAVAVGNVSLDGWRRFREDGYFASVTWRVLIGDVIGCGVQSPLIGSKGLSRDPH